MLASIKIQRIGSLDSTLSFWSQSAQWEQEIYIENYICGVRAALNALKAGDLLSDLAGIGFKTVHGGAMTHCLIDDAVMKAMEQFTVVAPLHNRIYLEVIRAFQKVAPELPMAAIFETAFHHTIPEHAYTYAVPLEWRDNYGVRKYGFHGASHSYISQRISQLMGRTDLKVISCHLGGSSSLCAIKNGNSIDATQGFSPQSGIAMGTRNGDLDVYALFHMMHNGFTVEQLNNILYEQSGLKGLSGVSDDMRELELAAAQGNSRAQLTLSVYCYDIVRYIGAYWALLGGLDAIVFTGGIGENSLYIRARVLRMLEHMGVIMDPEKNQANLPDSLISHPDSAVPVYLIRTNEELMVAQQTAAVLQAAQERS